MKNKMTSPHTVVEKASKFLRQSNYGTNVCIKCLSLFFFAQSSLFHNYISLCHRILSGYHATYYHRLITKRLFPLPPPLSHGSVERLSGILPCWLDSVQRAHKCSLKTFCDQCVINQQASEKWCGIFPDLNIIIYPKTPRHPLEPERMSLRWAVFRDVSALVMTPFILLPISVSNFHCCWEPKEKHSNTSAPHWPRICAFLYMNRTLLSKSVTNYRILTVSQFVTRMKMSPWKHSPFPSGSLNYTLPGIPWYCLRPVLCFK